MSSTGIGFFPTRDYGVLPKCKYCDATNVVKEARNQLTCPKSECRLQAGRDRSKSVFTDDGILPVVGMFFIGGGIGLLLGYFWKGKDKS